MLPELVGGVNLSVGDTVISGVGEICLDGSYVYAAKSGNGLRIANVSNPASPTRSGTYNPAGVQVWDVAVAGGYAYITCSHATGGELRVLDVSDPALPTWVGTYTSPDLELVFAAVDVSDGYAYVAGEEDIIVLDLGDPVNPQRVSGIYSGYPVDIRAMQNQAIVYDFYRGLFFLDVSDPLNPLVGAGRFSATEAGGPGMLVVNEGMVYLGGLIIDGSNFSSLLEVYDASLFDRPALVGAYQEDGGGTSVFLEGSYVYQVIYLRGIRVHDSHALSTENLVQTQRLAFEESPIDSVRIASVQADSIRWEVTADGGLNWQEISASGIWSSIAHPGEDLRWRTSLYDVMPGVQPNCSWLRIDWHNEIDVEGPLILHTPPGPHSSESAVSVELGTIDDVGTGVDSVWVNYRHGGDAVWTIMPVDLAATSFDIPQSFMTDRGIQYRIYAKDGAGNVSVSPSDGVHTIELLFAGNGIRRSTPDGAAVGQYHGTNLWDYRLFSIPLQVSDSHPSAVLVDDLGPYDEREWRFGEYQNGEPVYFGDSRLRSFEPGRAFFLLVRQAARFIDSGPGTTVSTAGPKFIDLTEEGWNLIGNPFAFSIPVSNISWPDGSPILPGHLKKLSGSGASLWIDETDSIEPWEGYALFDGAGEEQVVFNPSIDGARRTPPVSERLRAADEATSLNWLISLHAWAGGLGDTANVVGMVEGAQDGPDVHDLPEPPAWEGWTKLYFPHDTWDGTNAEFSADFRSPGSAGERWDFEVTHGIGAVSILLEAAGLERIPLLFEVYLYDSDRHEAHDLRADPQWYVLPAGTGEVRHFTLAVATSEYLASDSLLAAAPPPVHGLDQNSPNPFNQSTLIRFALPRGGFTELRIYDVRGRLVKTLAEGERPAGYHAVVWDGTDEDGCLAPGGVYFSRLGCPGFAAERKMLLLK